MAHYTMESVPPKSKLKDGDTYKCMNGRGLIFHNGEWEDQEDMNKPTAKSSQVGGTHYTDMAIQPFEYIHKNNLGYLEGTAVKYVSRWRAKGGIQDLEKAVHAIQFLIEMEQQSVKGGA